MPERKSTRVQRICEKCGKLFFPPPQNVKAGWGKFCSRFCRGTPAEMRFHKHVWKSSEMSCHIWTGTRTFGGYGRICLGKVGDGYIYAHRLAYQMFHGKIPDGLQICHSCDNPQCVNPEHLFPGTGLENVHDMIAKGRMSRGEKRGNSKLTAEKVTNIRSLYARGGISLSTIASQFDVCPKVVHRIILRQTWKHVA